MEKVFILIMLFLIVFILFINKFNIANPVSIFVLIWCFMIFSSVFIWEPNYEWNYLGVYWILIACFVCELGGIYGKNVRLKRNSSYINSSAKFSKKIIDSKVKLRSDSWRYLALFIILAFCKVLLDLYIYGFSILSVFRINTWGEISSDITAERYSTGGTFSLVGQILSLFVYLAPLYAGFCLVFAKKKKQSLLCYLSFFPMILSVILTSAKAGFIACVMLFIIGYATARIETRTVIRLKIKTLLILVILGLICLIFLFWAMLWRVGGERSYIQIILDKFWVYMFGSVPAFDNWLGNYYSFDLGYGKDTFLALSSALGLNVKIQGIYEMLDGYADSNVFTAFRALIQDFGVLGSLVFVFLIGYLGTVSYRKLKKGSSMNVISILVYQYITFYIMWGFIVSCWVYTTYMLIFPMFICVYYVSVRKTNKGVISVKNQRVLAKA